MFQSYRQNPKPKGGFVSGFLNKTRDMANSRTWSAVTRGAESDNRFTLGKTAKKLGITYKKAQQLEKDGILVADEKRLWGWSPFSTKEIKLYNPETQQNRYNLHKRSEKTGREPAVEIVQIKDYLPGNKSDYEIKKRHKQKLTAEARKAGFFKKAMYNPFKATENIIAYEKGIKKGESPTKLIKDTKEKEESNVISYKDGIGKYQDRKKLKKAA